MATADRIAEISNRAFERLFVRRFPGIQLKQFRFGDSGNWMWAKYWGTQENLLRYKLVDARAIPVAPKRKGWHGEFTAEKRRKGLLEVHLRLDHLTPKDHPLTMLGPLSWPFASTDEDRRQLFDITMRQRMGHIHSIMEAVQALATGSIAGCQFSQDSREQVNHLIRDFENAVSEATRAAHIEYEHREKPFLRLVKGPRCGASAATEVSHG